MLPLFYAALFLAAGSNASPCKASSSSSAPAAAMSSGAATSGGDATPEKKAAAQVVGSSNNAAALSTPSNSSSSGSLALPPSYSQGASAPASSASGSIAPASGGGSCPDGFINTVFNTVAPKNAGWPGTTWSSLSGNGVNQWIGFSLGTLDTKDTYGNPPVTPALNAAQIHVVMDPRDVDAAIKMVQGANPPAYLELFNEPDFSFDNETMVTDAATSAHDLSGLFSIPHPHTTYISPALMNANDPNWLPTFKSNCNGWDQIPIIAQHLYDSDPDHALSLITQLHGTWPDKKIWITELSPATADCSMDATAMAAYMNKLIPNIIKLGYVEKIFWNSGEWDSPPINNAPAACNPALTDASGNPTDVLTSLKQACGGSAGTATS